MAAKKKSSDALIDLKKQIKDGNLAPLYIFCGEEAFLRDMYVRRVKDAVPDGGFPEFNHIKLEGKDIPFSEYDDAWETFPMMTDRKLIHIKNSDIFSLKRNEKGENGATNDEKKEFWTEKFKRISDDTVVIFDETNVDKRSALYKAAAKAGKVIEFNYLSEADLVTWVIKQCLDAKKKISKENAYYLITLCDPGLGNINNELKKLLEYCDTEILRSDIERVVSKSLQVIVFELTDAILAGNAAGAMSTLTDLKTIKESPFTMMYLMLSNFEKLLRTKLMQGASRSEIMSALGVAPFIANKYIESAQAFSVESLKWMVRRVAEIDLEIKEGRVDEWTALEQYVMECIHNSQ